MRVADLAHRPAGETVTKSDREIMEILESYDLTRCPHSAAQLAGCDAKTVRRYVALRDAGGGDPLLVRAAPRPKLIDAFMAKVEELVDASKGKIRADKGARAPRRDGVHRHGTHDPAGGAAGEAGGRAGRRRAYRPWLTEPGLWLQFDWGDGLYRSETRFGYAACEYSLISPPRILLRLIRAAARSTTTSGVASVALGGR